MISDDRSRFLGEKSRRVCDKEFKVEAVRLVTFGDRRMIEIAEALNIWLPEQDDVVRWKRGFAR